ncbi:hypothetical protein B0187_00385 [Haemophilus paracuniculus]|uniref:SPOR domain-containing protein n=1 Tax=Haemophilus paracuniculus TaxID=734 RepID=A0A1T0AVR8_9PAST|nr:SPOR domain-containing protein [Haemophilus paracuniculus]OOS00793.1 hypothetical protein B0187_00385 [Haemophilus paracuniculus]
MTQQRDYAGESKKKGNVKISKILATIAGICIVFGLGLWLLKENTPAQPIPASAIQPPTPPKSSLPSRPDEVYSYIRDLETREVPLDKRVQAQLNAEQEKKLKEEEERRKQEEQLRLAAEQKAQEPQITIMETVQNQPATEQVKPQTPTAKVEAREATPEEIAAAKKAQEQKALERAKLAEEKRKQELKKQQELAKKAEQEKANAAKSAEQLKTEQAKAEQAKADQLKAEKEKADKTKAEQAKKVEQAKPQKVVAVAAKPNEQVSNQAGRFGLQCGAFKNKAQAENMQARLAMAGYNARIVSSADWNRVFIGPVGDRASASSAQSNARSVAECVIVSM